MLPFCRSFGEGRRPEVEGRAECHTASTPDQGTGLGQEECQTRERNNGRGPGDAGESRGLCAGARQLDTAQKPPDIENDVLHLEPTGEDFCCCSHVVTAEQKKRLVSELSQARENLVETYAQLPNNRCHLMEVCCSPTSGLTERMNKKGGCAYRIGL